MTTDAERMEALSRAYLQAVVAACGLTFSERSADYGIDLTLHEVERRGGRFRETGLAVDVQLKCTTRAVWRSRAVAFDLDATAHDDLIRAAPYPRILAVLAVPPAAARWLSVTERRLGIGGAMSLAVAGRRGSASESEFGSRRDSAPAVVYSGRVTADNGPHPKREAAVMRTPPVTHVPPRREFMLLDRWMVSEDELQAIQLADFRAFMARNGWVSRSHPKRGWYPYTHPDIHDDSGVPIELFIIWGDTGLRHLDTVARLLVSLSQCHDTTPDVILSKLTASAAQPATV